MALIVDTKLSFDDHINQVVNKVTKMTKIIRRTFQFLDKDTIVPLYKTTVGTRLDYAIAARYPYKKKKYVIATENVKRRAIYVKKLLISTYVFVYEEIRLTFFFKVCTIYTTMNPHLNFLNGMKQARIEVIR